MDRPREVRAVKVALILRTLMKHCDVLDPPGPRAGVVRPGALPGRLLRRMHALRIPDERLRSRDDLVLRHVKPHEGIEAVPTLVLRLAVREPGKRSRLPPVRGPLVRVKRRGDVPRDQGHQLRERHAFRG